MVRILMFLKRNFFKGDYSSLEIKFLSAYYINMIYSKLFKAVSNFPRWHNMFYLF